MDAIAFILGKFFADSVQQALISNRCLFRSEDRQSPFDCSVPDGKRRAVCRTIPAISQVKPGH